MMYTEFTSLTGKKVSLKKYTNEIEPEYMTSELSKQEFCTNYIESTKRTKNKDYKMVEMQRNDITLSQFFSQIKTECKKKGLDFSLERDRKEFENPPRLTNIHYYIKDDKQIYTNDGYRTEHPASEASCKSEIYRVKPLDYQSYQLNFDGSCYNEICEFTYDDEKTGHGYYYQVCKDAE